VTAASESPESPVTSAEVIGYLQRYVEDQGFGTPAISPETELADLGLDSIHLAELLLTARADLAAAGRIPVDATLTTLPRFVTVTDLVDVVRNLGQAS
jgi:acyl carrier protein